MCIQITLMLDNRVPRQRVDSSMRARRVHRRNSTAVTVQRDRLASTAHPGSTREAGARKVHTGSHMVIDVVEFWIVSVSWSSTVAAHPRLVRERLIRNGPQRRSDRTRTHMLPN